MRKFAVIYLAVLLMGATGIVSNAQAQVSPPPLSCRATYDACIANATGWFGVVDPADAATCQAGYVACMTAAKNAAKIAPTPGYVPF